MRGQGQCRCAVKATVACAQSTIAPNNRPRETFTSHPLKGKPDTHTIRWLCISSTLFCNLPIGSKGSGQHLAVVEELSRWYMFGFKRWTTPYCSQGLRHLTILAHPVGYSARTTIVTCQWNIPYALAEMGRGNGCMPRLLSHRLVLFFAGFLPVRVHYSIANACANSLPSPATTAAADAICHAVRTIFGDVSFVCAPWTCVLGARVYTCVCMGLYACVPVNYPGRLCACVLFCAYLHVFVCMSS